LISFYFIVPTCRPLLFFTRPCIPRVPVFLKGGQSKIHLRSVPRRLPPPPSFALPRSLSSPNHVLLRMSGNTTATVSLEQLRGSRATFPPKRIELWASGDYSAMLGLASGPTPSGEPPTCQPNNGLFPSFAVETKTGCRSLTKDHAELVFDPVTTGICL